MTSFLPATHLEPLLKVPHRTLQHFLRQGCRPGGFPFMTSGSSKCFNPSKYSVSIWQNCASTLNNELSTEKTLDSNYGITVSKKLLDSKHMMLCSNAPWLLKVHCLRCPPAQAQCHQPHPCWVPAIWKTCVSSAPPCIYLMFMNPSIVIQLRK
jgi:hypothetical protein